jgi:hypothetical protein
LRPRCFAASVAPIDRLTLTERATWLARKLSRSPTRWRTGRIVYRSYRKALRGLPRSDRPRNRGDAGGAPIFQPERLSSHPKVAYSIDRNTPNAMQSTNSGKAIARRTTTRRCGNRRQLTTDFIFTRTNLVALPVVRSRLHCEIRLGTSLNRRGSVTSFANRKRRPPQAPPVGLLSCRWLRSAAWLYEDQQSVRAKSLLRDR